MQNEKASQEVKRRDKEATKKLAEAQAALEEAAQRENTARRATAELQRLDKQLSARKLDAKELQVGALVLRLCLSPCIMASCHALPLATGTEAQLSSTPGTSRMSLLQQ